MGMAPRTDATQGMSLDLRSLDRLKTASGSQPKGAIREAAKQLETLFMQELLKSMRATTMNSGLLENEGTDLGNSMLDTQLAGQMTGMPGGLSEQIVKQLERQLGQVGQDKASPRSLAAGLGPAGLSYAPAADAAPARAETAPTQRSGADSGKRLSASEQFIRKHQAAAEAASSVSGIPASNILGQAALESGWGKHEIRKRDGSNSHNLFGIKATADWKGQVAEVTTTEYIGGVARKVTAKFKAYESYADAFKDHARLLTSKPRYAQQQLANASDARSYASGLQRAGYATDPSYADKLTRVINTALRLQKTLT